MLSSTFSPLKIGRLMPVMLIALLLAGCQGSAPQYQPPNIQNEAAARSDYYLQRWQQSSAEHKTDWQLLAIRALIREGQLNQANSLLNNLPGYMSAIQQQERQLLLAELQLVSGETPAAIKSAERIDRSLLAHNQLKRFYQVLISANQDSASLPLLRAYIGQETLLSGKAHQYNLDKTWQTLLGLTPGQLSSMAIYANENVLLGWLDLLRIYRENQYDTVQLSAALDEWRIRYPDNPASRKLPAGLELLLYGSDTSSAKIALLLPLNGQAKIFSDAIEQGFVAAQMGLTQPATTNPTSTEAATASVPVNNSLTSRSEPAAEQINLDELIAQFAPALVGGATLNTSINHNTTRTPTHAGSVRVYDTTSQPLATLVAQAQRDGATLLVGPLLKTDVEQLASLKTSLNILALNQLEQPRDQGNICYFALSPEDEARDAARHIWQQQKRQPLLLLPQGEFGQRIARAFNHQWQQLGGQTVLQQNIGSAQELRQMISRGINMTGTPVLNPTPLVTSAITAELAAPLIDAVYIVANQDQLTLIKPMIDMNTTSGTKPALFASSRSYQASSGADFRLEMEGLQFSEIPLLAGADPALQQQASRQFNNDYSLVRLYAMGIDAWKLANHFDQLRQLPGFQLSGATGLLTAAPHCVINRKLTWLQYRQGSIVSVL
ncbi:penicillin-binding protein activator [Serratia microhaemolytica]|uniref:penicillin-binding protein activator n=1 Tax=Serratia microhaemolytica TaxID=2675110 RepID=UPI000FDF081D|nr:penicillin-binding protein activator [Serratia microhaemolytica]